MSIYSSLPDAYRPTKGSGVIIPAGSNITGPGTCQPTFINHTIRVAAGEVSIGGYLVKSPDISVDLRELELVDGVWEFILGVESVNSIKAISLSDVEVIKYLNDIFVTSSSLNSYPEQIFYERFRNGKSEGFHFRDDKWALPGDRFTFLSDFLIELDLPDYLKKSNLQDNVIEVSTPVYLEQGIFNIRGLSVQGYLTTPIQRTKVTAQILPLGASKGEGVRISSFSYSRSSGISKFRDLRDIVGEEYRGVAKWLTQHLDNKMSESKYKVFNLLKL